MGPEEWDALAWWKQAMYLEGYEEEGIVGRGADGGQDPSIRSEQVHQSGGTTITERHHESTFSGQPGEFAAFGIPERSL